MIITALTADLARVLGERVPAELIETMSAIVQEGTWWASVPAGALVILDPLVFVGDSVSIAMAGIAFTAAAARIVFYTSFSPESMRAVALAASLHPVELWLAGIDDSAKGFGNRVQRIATHGLVADVLPELLATADTLPGSIRGAVVAVFATPERFFEAADVAHVAMTSRRNLDRYLADNGLGTAHRLIVAAKMIHGVMRLGGSADVSRSVRSVSDSLGYSDPEVFARQFVDVFGIRPAARGSLNATDVVGKVVAYARYARGPRLEGIVAAETPTRQLAAR